MKKLGEQKLFQVPFKGVSVSNNTNMWWEFHADEKQKKLVD